MNNEELLPNITKGEHNTSFGSTALLSTKGVQNCFFGNPLILDELQSSIYQCKRKKGLRIIRFMRLYYVIYMVSYLSSCIKNFLKKYRLGTKESKMLK